MQKPDFLSVGSVLVSGGVVVMPTDTVYGLVGSALMPDTIERIYQIKGRSNDKPFVILVADIDDLSRLGVQLSTDLLKTLGDVWPGPANVFLPRCR